MPNNIIKGLFYVWSNGSLEHAVKLAKMAIDSGKLPKTIKICEYAAILDGEWYFAIGDDMYPERTGLQLWSGTNIVKPRLSKQAQFIADEIVEYAKAEAVAFAEDYDAWEASWIDGPDPCNLY